MLRNYLKLAWKVLMRRKVFTFISLFGICLTLVVLMVATALLDHIVAPHAPETNMDRTLGVFQVHLSGEQGSTIGAASYAFLDKYVRPLPEVERVAIFEMQTPVAAYKDGRTLSLFIKRTDGEFWKILRFHFLEGGPFSSIDEKNANFVAVINESTRRKIFGDEAAVGKTIIVDGQRFRVGGVVDDVPFIRIVPFADVWVPISTSKQQHPRDATSGHFMGLVLAKDRRDFPELRAEFAAATAGAPLPEGYDRLDTGLDTFFEFVSRAVFREPHPGMLRVVLWTFALLFMILPAINLVNLNLSRIMERASEIGVRKAFGATRITLVGQFIVENVILTLIGGFLALLASGLVLAILNRVDLIPYAEFSLNYRIFARGLVIAIVFGLVSGVYPAWRMSRLQPANALKGTLR